MTTETPYDLLFDQLRDLHNVEVQLRASLPSLAARAHDERLRSMLVKHGEETVDHFDQLNGIFRSHGIAPGHDVSLAMEGLIKGGDAHLAQVEEPTTHNLMMVAHCLRIEYYEIAGYKIAMHLAEQLGLEAECGILRKILASETHAAGQLEKLQPQLFDLAAGKPA